MIFESLHLKKIAGAECWQETRLFSYALPQPIPYIKHLYLNLQARLMGNSKPWLRLSKPQTCVILSPHVYSDTAIHNLLIDPKYN